MPAENPPRAGASKFIYNISPFRHGIFTDLKKTGQALFTI
jgi:hypothetical protein